MTTTIPSPPSVPFLGHITAIEKEVPQRSFGLLAEQYGDIYQLNFLGMCWILLASRPRRMLTMSSCEQTGL